MRHAGVDLEGDVKAELLEHVGAHLAELGPREGVGTAVAHPDLCVPVEGLGLVLDLVAKLVAQQQPAAEADDAAELDGGGEAGEEGHGAALGEAAEDDAVGGDAGVDLGLDEAVEVAGRDADAGVVLVLAQRLDAAVDDALGSRVSPGSLACSAGRTTEREGAAGAVMRVGGLCG